MWCWKTFLWHVYQNVMRCWLLCSEVIKMKWTNPMPFNVYMNNIPEKCERRTWNAKFNLEQQKNIVFIWVQFWIVKKIECRKKLLMKCPNGAFSQVNNIERWTTTITKTLRLIKLNYFFLHLWLMNSNHENVCYARNANPFEFSTNTKNLTHPHAMRVC